MATLQIDEPHGLHQDPAMGVGKDGESTPLSSVAGTSMTADGDEDALHVRAAATTFGRMDATPAITDADRRQMVEWVDANWRENCCGCASSCGAIETLDHGAIDAAITRQARFPVATVHELRRRLQEHRLDLGEQDEQAVRRLINQLPRGPWTRISLEHTFTGFWGPALTAGYQRAVAEVWHLTRGLVLYNLCLQCRGGKCGDPELRSPCCKKASTLLYWSFGLLVELLLLVVLLVGIFLLTLVVLGADLVLMVLSILLLFGPIAIYNMGCRCFYEEVAIDLIITESVETQISGVAQVTIHRQRRRRVTTYTRPSGLSQCMAFTCGCSRSAIDKIITSDMKWGRYRYGEGEMQRPLQVHELQYWRAAQRSIDEFRPLACCKPLPQEPARPYNMPDEV